MTRTSPLTEWLTSTPVTVDSEPSPDTLKVLRGTSYFLRDNRDGLISEVNRAVRGLDDGEELLKKQLLPLFIPAGSESVPVKQYLHGADKDVTLLGNLFDLCSRYPDGRYGRQLLEIRHSQSALELDPETRSRLLNALIENQVKSSQWDDWKSIVLTGRTSDGLLHGRSVDGWDGWRLSSDGRPRMDRWAEAVKELVDDEDRLSVALRTLDQVPESFPLAVGWEAKLLDFAGEYELPEHVILRFPFLMIGEPSGPIILWKKYASFFKVLIPDLHTQVHGETCKLRLAAVQQTTAGSILGWIRVLEKWRNQWVSHPNADTHECYNNLKDGLELLSQLAREQDNAFLVAVFRVFQLILLPPELTKQDSFWNVAASTHNSVRNHRPMDSAIFNIVSELDKLIPSLLAVTSSAQVTQRDVVSMALTTLKEEKERMSGSLAECISSIDHRVVA